jgi:hypothetical protein
MIQKNRFQLCLKYRLRGMVKPSLVFLGIFLFVDLILPLILFIVFEYLVFAPGGQIDINYGGLAVSYPFLLSGAIFLFVGAIASFRENFNFLLTLNNTRRNQYGSELVFMVISGGCFFIVSFVVHLLEMMLELFSEGKPVGDGMAAYLASLTGDHLGKTAIALLLTLAAFIFAYALGLAAGVLSYRFGRYFLIPFWVCFGTSFAVVPILITSYRWFSKLAQWFIGYGRPLPDLTLAFHLLATALLLAAIGALFIRKMPQNSAT